MATGHGGAFWPPFEDTHTQLCACMMLIAHVWIWRATSCPSSAFTLPIHVVGGASLCPSRTFVEIRQFSIIISSDSKNIPFICINFQWFHHFYLYSQCKTVICAMLPDSSEFYFGVYSFYGDWWPCTVYFRLLVEHWGMLACEIPLRLAGVE